MSAGLRHRVAIAAVVLALTGCGARVSLGEYVLGDVSADGGVAFGATEPFDADPFDAEALDASSETDPPEASDDASVDDGPASDATVD